MKLNGIFFYILDNSLTELGFVTTIKFNPSHIIYSGHFPGYPVTPGVVQMQIVHELVENHLGRKLKLISMPQCKFVKVLNPIETSFIDVIIELRQAGNLHTVSAYGKNSTDVFFKLSSTYQVIE